MGGGSESKKQLGKILLQQKLVSSDELQEMLDEQKRDPRKRLASAAALRGRVSIADALQALSEQHGIDAVDLTEQVVPLALLRLVPIELAEEHIVFPVRLEEDRLVMAMSSPDAKEVLEELEFVTGKAIVPLVTLDHALRGVILHAYAAFKRGQEYYVGAHVTASQLADMGLPDLPRAPDSLVPAPLPPAGVAPPPASSAADVAPPPAPAAAGVAPPPAPAAAGVAPPPAPAGVPPPPPPAGVVPAEARDDARRPSVPPPLDEAFSRRMPPSRPPAPLGAVQADVSVLLAIADPELRAAISRALQDSQLSVLETDDGAHALTLLDSSPRLVVLEANLASAHGFDVCRNLRADARYATLPVIVIRAVAGDWRYARDLQESLGVQHCFDRPLDVAKLVFTARLLLDGQPVIDELPPLSGEAEAHWAAAMTAFEGGDLDAAIAELRAGVELDANAFELHYHLGLLHGRRDELFAAVRELGIALRLQPQNFLAMKNLAVIYQRVGFRYAALDAWQRAAAHAPDEETRANIKQHMVSLL